jgi:hypothetical protein
MKKVFLSYARLDLKQARRLCRDLRKLNGVTVWFDMDDLLPGMRWRPAIRKAIRESRYFIALMSKKSVAKRGFRHSELRQAIEIFDEFPDDKIFLIPTRLDACTPPMEALENITYADLFPDWADGVSRLGKSLGVTPKKRAARKKAKRKVLAKKVKAPEYYYKVGLADLDVGRIKLQTMVRGLNKVQRFFRFTPAHLAPSRAALRRMDGKRHIDIDRLSRQFYAKVGPLHMDYVVGITHRYLMFEEDGNTYYNYLGAPSGVDERVMFASIGGLADYAEEADVSFDTALAYVVVSQLAGYFVDIEYHDVLRGCPWDFTEDHADMVKGLRDARICSACSKKLKKNPKLAKAVNDMLSWGR